MSVRDSNDHCERLERIELKLDFIILELAKMSANLSANFLALQTQVQATTTVEQSAITLINGLATQLAAAIAAAANGDTAALPTLQTQLATSAAALSAAITANTPAAPVTPPASTTTTS
jgi:hypothetical protein